MTEMMRAYRLRAWQSAPELVEVPVPVPGPGEVLVQVGGCGLCHSDLAMMTMPESYGAQLGWSMPFTLGHETAGWVAAVGPPGPGGGAGGDLERWAVGDAVAVSSPSWCGTCRHCRAGHENACPQGAVGRGYGRDGGLADHVLVDDARALYRLGSLEPAVAAPLTDAGATSHHAVARVLGRLPDDGTVVVLGVGGLGAFVVQILRALSPARIVAVDPDPARRAVAQGFGADVTLDGVDDDTVPALREALGDEGAHAVIDLVGTDATLACATAIAARRGVVGLVGAAGGTLRRPWYPTLPRDGEVFTFQGSDRADALAVLALAEAGRIQVETVPVALDDVATAYARLEAGGLAGRLVVVP